MNINFLRDWLININLDTQFADVLNFAFVLILIFLIALLLDFLSKKIIVIFVTKIVRKSKNHWDDMLLRKKVFRRLGHFVPAIVIYHLIELAYGDFEQWVHFIQTGTFVYMIIIGLLFIDSLINAFHEIYLTLPVSKTLPIKGYVQVIKIFFYAVSAILVISVILEKSPVSILTGMGALAAVLILVFRDTILGFVASIQLSANKMVNPGDWITMPSHNADGVVTEISLNTVKVQNWDKTVSTIPTYSLVSESFYNWKSMQESGGRRIKRSLNIDMKSIKFCDKELIEKLRNINLIRDYIDRKLDEIENYNQKRGSQSALMANKRWITNIGTFRKYVEFYLQNHPKTRTDMTYMVRQLQPADKGLPLEVYVFADDIRWTYYEEIQSDIFDHLIAIMPEFELKLFQSPSGEDVQKINMGVSSE